MLKMYNPQRCFRVLLLAPSALFLRTIYYVIGVYFITPYLEANKKKPQLTELYISSSYC